MLLKPLLKDNYWLLKYLSNSFLKLLWEDNYERGVVVCVCHSDSWVAGSNPALCDLFSTMFFKHCRRKGGHGVGLDDRGAKPWHECYGRALLSVPPDAGFGGFRSVLFKL